MDHESKLRLEFTLAPVVSEIRLVSRKHPVQPHVRTESERMRVCRREKSTKQNLAVISKADKTTVECRMQIRCEQKAIEAVEAFAVAGFAPRLDMRCLENGGCRALGDGALATPQFL